MSTRLLVQLAVFLVGGTLASPGRLDASLLPPTDSLPKAESITHDDPPKGSLWLDANFTAAYDAALKASYKSGFWTPTALKLYERVRPGKEDAAAVDARYGVWAKRYLSAYLPDDEPRRLAGPKGANLKKKKAFASAEEKEEFETLALEETLSATSTLLSTTFCWRNAYDRGVGKPAPCDTDRGWLPGPGVLEALCYRDCPATYGSGWTRDLEFCQEDCPHGTSTAGLHCKINGGTTSKCDVPGSKCPGIFGNCGDLDCLWRKSCPEGWFSTGLFCEPHWYDRPREYSPATTKYADVTSCPVLASENPPMTDGPRLTPLGHFCYPEPKEGYGCWLTACQENCPPHMVECGPGACALDDAACVSNIVDMVAGVGAAVASTAALIASFGTAAPATVGASVGVRTALKQGAKSVLKSLQKALTKAGMKAAIKNFAKKNLNGKAVKKFGKELVEDYKDDFIDGAFEATAENIMGATEDGMEAFDFTLFDPSGIASAVKSSAEGEDSAAEQAANWVEVVGNFDPSGWVAASAAFIHDMCGSLDCEIVSIQLDIKKYGSEMSFTIDEDKATGGQGLIKYENKAYAPEPTSVCLSKGEHDLELKDSYGDGWHGGTLTISYPASGEQIWSGSMEGSSETFTFTVVGQDEEAGEEEPTSFTSCDQIVGRTDAYNTLGKWCYQLDATELDCADYYTQNNDGNGVTRLCYSKPGEDMCSAIADKQYCQASFTSCEQIVGRTDAYNTLGKWCYNLNATTLNCADYYTQNNDPGGNGATRLCYSKSGEDICSATADKQYC